MFLKVMSVNQNEYWIDTHKISVMCKQACYVVVDGHKIELTKESYISVVENPLLQLWG